MTSAHASDGFAFYVDELRRGSTDPYVAYRVYEKGWSVPRKDVALLRRAAIRLLEADPWFLATATPLFLHALTSEDLERLTPFVGAGPARAAAAMLRATLWYHACKGPRHPDRQGRAQLRRALGFVQKVPRNQRDSTWHEMLVGCYRALDHERYKRAFPRLLEATPGTWRASPLYDFLETVSARKDWAAYDRHRHKWDELPPGHHACECYVNGVYTDDGLRAAAARRWDDVPAALARAAEVRGCAHLNTGGFRLELVRLLISKNKQLEAARGYLMRAAGFGGGRKEVAKLRRELEARRA